MSNTHSPFRRRVNRYHTHHSESSGTKTSTCFRHHIIPHPNPVYLTAPNAPTDSKHSENATKPSPPYALPSPSSTYPSHPHSTHPPSPHRRTPSTPAPSNAPPIKNCVSKPRSSKYFYFPPVHITSLNWRSSMPLDSALVASPPAPPLQSTTPTPAHAQLLLSPSSTTTTTMMAAQLLVPAPGPPPALTPTPTGSANAYPAAHAHAHTNGHGHAHLYPHAHNNHPPDCEVSF